MCRHCGQPLLPDTDTADSLHPPMSSPPLAADKARMRQAEGLAFYVPEAGGEQPAPQRGDEETAKVKQAVYVCPECGRGFESELKPGHRARCRYPDCGFEWFVRTETLVDSVRADKREMSVTLAVVRGPDRGKTLNLQQGEATIGSGDSCDLRLGDHIIAEIHARLVLREKALTIHSGANAGAVVVNGQPRRVSRLTHGDMVLLGKTTLSVQITYEAKKIPGKARKAMLSEDFTGSAKAFVDGKEVDSIPLGVAPVTFGRSKTRDVQLRSQLVSKRHATVVYEGGSHHVIDNGAKQGTLINGKAVIRQALKVGDTVQMGPFVFTYRDGCFVRQIPE